MKQFLHLLACILLSFGAKAQLADIIPLPHYFVKNTVALHKGYNCKVISRQQDLDQYAGIAKTSTNAVTIPDFDHFIVVSIAKPVTKANTTLTFNKAELSGSCLKVWCTETKGEAIGYSILPSSTAMIAKPAALKQVYFYCNGKLVQKVRR